MAQEVRAHRVSIHIRRLFRVSECLCNSQAKIRGEDGKGGEGRREEEDRRGRGRYT